jgi:hypothetical protein
MKFTIENLDTAIVAQCGGMDEKSQFSLNPWSRLYYQ